MKIHNIWLKHGRPNFERREIIRAKYLDVAGFYRAICNHFHEPIDDMLVIQIFTNNCCVATHSGSCHYT